MNVSSCCWSLFHANECVFSRNEQLKVYIQVEMLTLLQVMQLRYRRLTHKTLKYRLNRNLLKIPAISQAAQAQFRIQ